MPSDPEDLSRAHETGRRAVAGLGRSLRVGLAAILRKDPERLDQATELGLVSEDWMADPRGDAPISNAQPIEVIHRLLERSVEQRPSFLGSIGLSVIEALAASDESDESGGTEQRLTVVFTDLEGFTRYTARQGDEAASALLDHHRRTTGPIIRRRGGRVVKRLGDGLLITFEQPEAAVRACVELVESAPEPLRMRAGAHVGEVVVHPDDVMGHTVNVAARVTEEARGGEVMISTELRAALDDLGDLGDLDGRRVGRARRRRAKGLDQPISICPVTRT